MRFEITRSHEGSRLQQFDADEDEAYDFTSDLLFATDEEIEANLPVGTTITIERTA